jgi:diguanylate cyclase (GGDEF)-like protein
MQYTRVRLTRAFGGFALALIVVVGLAFAFDGWRESSRLEDVTRFEQGAATTASPGSRAGWPDRLPFWAALSSALGLATAWLFWRLVHLESRSASPGWIDPLTDLPNLYLLEDRLQRAINEAGRDGRRVALILVDLDQFRRINEAYGRAVGDQALQRIAQRIGDLLREVDTLARVNGDQFAVAARIDEPDQAELIAGKIVTALAEPCEFLGTQVSINANVGMAFFPDHGRDTNTLLQHAEFALGLAAESADRRAVYAPERDFATPDRLALLAGLPDALRSGQLYLVYQPKQDVGRSRSHRYEALVRWRHPGHGELEPSRFLPLIEQTGAIVQLTQWAIREVLRLAAASGPQPSDLEIAINLSARLLDDLAFPLWTERYLREHCVPAHKIRFEVTESAVMNDSARALQVLQGLAALGVTISLDDFGIGHSSLAYLARLPVDELKIDQSFVSNMLTRKPDRAIVRATVGLAHDLGLRVVAEGVENAEQAALLSEFGCDALQGHWVGRPVRGMELLAGWAA